MSIAFTRQNLRTTEKISIGKGQFWYMNREFKPEASPVHYASDRALPSNDAHTRQPTK